jgi:hypothetical protein
MNINRHNYEEYFILYMDNELGAEDRRSVEAFVQLHPDLKEELDLLLQYKMQPDAEVVFDGKEELMKVVGEKPILLSNYEEWLILYNDNELTPAQRTTVEEFMAANPVFRAEQELLLKTKLQPDVISFPEKQSLYRNEEKIRRIAGARWWRMAAAAVLLLAVAGSAIVILNNKKQGEEPGIVTNNPDEVITPQTNTPGNPVTFDETNNKVAVTENSYNPVKNNAAENNTAVKQAYNLPVRQNDKTLVKNNDKPEIKEKQPANMPAPENKIQNAVALENKTSNNLTQPDNNPNVNPAIKSNKDDAVAVNEKLNPETKVLTTSPNPDVTTAALNPLNNGNPEDDETMEEGGKNRKNRGIFRKLTRNLVKRSNASTKDDENDSKLLVGGFAFRIK